MDSRVEFIMLPARIYLVTAAFIGSLAMPLSAAMVHKWVDANGITHYSDTPPPADAGASTRIDVSVDPRRESKGNYHSIANQWARMQKEIIEREKIKLEKARLQAAQQAGKTEVVYVEQPRESTRYIGIYRAPRYLRHGRYHSHYRHGGPRGHAKYKSRHRAKYRSRHRGAGTRGASLGYYKYTQ